MVRILTDDGVPLGSGFFIQDPMRRSDWYVVTNAHVVDSNDTVTVSWWYSDIPDLRRVGVLGVDEHSDVALLQVGPNDFDWSGTEWPNGLAYLNHWGEGITTSTNIRQGAQVIAMGFPDGGGGRTTTAGLISAPRARDSYYPGVDWIKTDTAINPGNSGGPLMTLQGEIIGMNTWIRADLENVGYALPMAEIFDRFAALKGGLVVRKPTPTPRAPIASYDDGSYLALLQWREDGGLWYKVADNDGPCVDRVTETDHGNGVKSYSWEYDCLLEGYFDGDDVFIDLNGVTYRVVEVTLDEKPY